MRTLSPASAAAMLAIVCLGPGAAPAAKEEPAPSPYELGAELVPGGDFAEVAPQWEQMRPDEGEKLAVVPVGWRAGYQGGDRRMPIPAIDPETRARCMDFEYGAGQVDLVSPVFDLPGPGIYLLDVRVKSVVNPSATALRGVVRLLPAEGEKDPSSEILVESMLGTGPERMTWSRRTALVRAGEGSARAEIHLVKNEELADFLVGGVSFRKILSLRAGVRIPLGEDAGASPAVYIPSPGSVEARAADANGKPAGALEARTGLQPAPGAMWEGWARVDAEPGSFGPVHLQATGADLFAQFRPEAGSTAAAVELRVTPYAGDGPPPAVVFERFENGARTMADDPARVVFPSIEDCTRLRLRRARAFALDAARGLDGDLDAAAAIVRAVEARAPFGTGGEPLQGGRAPSVKELLEDCGRATPMYCNEWKPDLIAAACACSGLACRAVSSRALGVSGPGVEGTEIWSAEESRWFLLPESEAATATGRAVKKLNLTAISAAEAAGAEVGVATDTRWGQRGWVSYHPASSPTPAEDDFTRLRLDADSIERPLRQTHLDLHLHYGNAISVEIAAAEDEDVHEYRFGPHAEWKRAGDEGIFWPLAAGDNDLEVRVVNALGARGTPARVTVSTARDIDPLAAAYEGLEAYAGDPHIHTGLAIYEILDSQHPLARGTPERAFETAKANGLDWAAVTDFASSIDDPRAVEMRKQTGNPLENPDGSKTFSDWEHLRAVVAAANAPHEFTAFLGVEFDPDGYSKQGGPGTKLILFPDDGAERYCSPMVQNVGDCATVEDAYRYARQEGAVMIASSPCRATDLRDTDWSRYDPVVSLMEIFGGACESGPGGFVEVTSGRRLPVGAAGGGTSMTATAGLYDRTICWAEENTRDALLSAMRQRRCFWSAAGSLDLAFTLNGAPMGREAPAGHVTAWAVRAENRTGIDFASVEILRDGQVIASAPCESATACRMEGGLGEPAHGVYYAAITGQDGRHIAVTSPVRAGLSGD